MNADIYLNGVKFEDLLSRGQLLIKALNDAEEKFRTKTRKQNPEYSSWQIKQYYNRKIIIDGNEYTYKLTSYKDTLTGKTFIYRHSEYLEILGSKMYDYTETVKAIAQNNLGRKKKKGVFNKVPYWVFYYWKRINFFSFLKQIQEYKKQTKDLKIQLDIDDCYLSVRVNNKVEKLRFRVVVFHTGYDNRNKKVDNKTTLIQLNKIPVPLEKQKKYDEELLQKIKEILTNIYGSSDVLIHGDGARFISEIAKKLNGVLYYDKFHFGKIAFDNLGWSKKKHKENKKLFEEKFGNVYNIFMDFISNLEFEKALKLLDNIKDYLFQKSKKMKLKNIKSFIKLIKNHGTSILNTMKKNHYGGCPETWIGHDIKRLPHKKFAVFGSKTILEQIELHSKNNIVVINGLNR